MLGLVSDREAAHHQEVFSLSAATVRFAPALIAMITWDDLSALDGRFLALAQKVYKTPLQLYGAFDDLQEACDVVHEMLGEQLDSDSVKRIGLQLHSWKERMADLGPGPVKLLCRSLVERPTKLARAAPSIGNVFEDLVASSPNISLTALGRALKARKCTGLSADELERLTKEKWGLALVKYIKAARLPVAERMEALGADTKAWLRLFGGRRGKSLRNRAREWGTFSDWLQATHGEMWPGNVGRVLRYLEERHELKPIGKSVPKSLLASFSLLETVGQVTPDGRFSTDPILVETVKSWTSDLEAGNLSVKQAPLYTVAIMLSLELLVCATSQALGLRFVAFCDLLMIWATLRADDLQHIDLKSVKLSQLGLKFCLRKTKTSGPGRKVGELFAYISRSSGLSGFDWLSEGMRLLSNDELSWARDYFCPALSDAWEVTRKGVLDAGGLAILIRKMLGCLREPIVKSGAWATSRNLLVPDTLRTYWSGHSARHTLPCIAAALGVEKDRRDFLGRWCYAQHGSQDYVLTSRQVVHGIQNLVSKTILEGSPGGGYIEEEVLASLKQACSDRSLDQSVILRRHSVAKWDSGAKTWKLFGRFPHIMIPPDQLQGASGDVNARLPGPYHSWSAEDCLGDSPFFVTVSRKGHRRLHLAKACAVRQERCIETIGIFSLDEASADSICKLCKPKISGAASSSSSGSEDSVAAADVPSGSNEAIAESSGG